MIKGFKMRKLPLKDALRQRRGTCQRIHTKTTFFKADGCTPWRRRWEGRWASWWT